MDKKVKPRSDEEVISWDEFFMGVAEKASERSKDPNTQVGACVANEKNHVMAVGYNGIPRKLKNDEFPWDREGESMLDVKYTFMCHAEQNAIDNRGSRELDNCTMYVTLFPCHMCAQRIIQNGITEVVYKDDKYSETESHQASLLMLKKAGVKVRQFRAKK